MVEIMHGYISAFACFSVICKTVFPTLKFLALPKKTKKIFIYYVSDQS